MTVPTGVPDMQPWSSGAAVPAPLTPLIGRSDAVAEVRRLLGTTRLLTLTGAGGSGKTRLAIEIAREEEGTSQFPGGVLWVELAAVRKAALLAEHVAATLGLPESRDRSPVDVLADTLRGRRVLLVLDNCEHLVDACAQLAEQLLRAAGSLTLLATTREALGLPGERTWLVPLLAVPTADEAADLQRAASIAAVQLFVERAAAVVPTFTLTAGNVRPVADLCRRLDGIPFAIELVAARVKVLAPEQILERLDTIVSQAPASARGVRARHRTLRETIDWSHQLLGPLERRLFARLAIFAGSFLLDAVEAVCTDDLLAPEQAIDLLSSLVDKSLVVSELGPDRSRYRLLETMRQYALNRLEEEGDIERWQQRLADYYVGLAEAAAPRLYGGADDLRLQAAFDEEIANMRAVEEWCRADPGRSVHALRLGAALYWFWFSRGRFQEGRSWLTAPLANGHDVPPLVRAHALVALGYVAFWRGEAGTIRPPLEQSIPILREAGDAPALVAALIGLAGAALVEGEVAEATSHIEEAYALQSAAESTVRLPFVLYWRGMIAMEAGRHALARESFERAVAVGRAIPHRRGIAHPLYALGMLEVREGRTAAAIEHLRESLILHGELDDRWGLFQALAAFARLTGEGDDLRAARILGGSDVVRARIGVQMSPRIQADYDERVETVRRRLGAEVFDRAWNEGRAMSIPDMVAYATAPWSAAAPPVRAARGTGTARTRVAQPDLRVCTLGPFDVVRKEKRLPARAWGSAKARELFVLLLCHPDGCTRERAGVALWPDASAVQVRNNFHVTLHRVRRALGDADWVLADADRYRVSQSRAVEFDAATFDAGARALLASLRVGTPLPPSADTVLSLYRGEFLEHEEAGDWHLPRRRELHQLYLDALLASADALVSGDREREALPRYQQLLGRDPVNERAVRGLMHAYARLGDRAAIRRIYEQLAAALRQDLDAQPEPETRALFRKLSADVV